MDRYWSLRGIEAEPRPEPLLPDGHAEIVLHFGEPFEGQSSALWAGQLDRAMVLQPSRRVDVFGIRFRPYGAFAFTGVPQSITVGRVLPLEEIGYRTMAERVGNAANRVAEADACLREARVVPVDPRVRFAAGQVSARPFARVEAIAAETGCSRRQLERLFQEQVGLAPKTFGIIRRLQHSVLLRRQRPDWTWCQVAAEAGYYDQAHLIADYRRLGGEAPEGLLAAQADFSRSMVRAAIG